MFKYVCFKLYTKCDFSVQHWCHGWVRKTRTARQSFAQRKPCHQDRILPQSTALGAVGKRLHWGGRGADLRLRRPVKGGAAASSMVGAVIVPREKTCPLDDHNIRLIDSILLTWSCKISTNSWLTTKLDTVFMFVCAKHAIETAREPNKHTLKSNQSVFPTLTVI